MVKSIIVSMIIKFDRHWICTKFMLLPVEGIGTAVATEVGMGVLLIMKTIVMKTKKNHGICMMVSAYLYYDNISLSFITFFVCLGLYFGSSCLSIWSRHDRLNNNTIFLHSFYYHCHLSGSLIECKYRLRVQYGIPSDNLPLTIEGELILSQHIEWVNQRKKLESST